jgi:NAD(P)-dependent dehydrogenase (short-subunit alcohol dehydrogenase family)
MSAPNASTPFAGKAALVTGAGSGLGEAIAVDLAAKGASVVIADINTDGAKRVADLITAAGGTAVAYHLDTTNVQQNVEAVAFAEAEFGALHYAVNNAGVGARTQLPAGELDIVVDWDRIIAINLNGVLYGMHAEIPAILRAGGGAIVNMASIHGFVAAPGNSAYVASKHGVIGLTKNAAIEYATKGLRINAVAPGYIATPAVAALPQDFKDAVTAKVPTARLGEPSEVATVVSFLLSADAQFVTGSVYTMDGGFTAQ